MTNWFYLSEGREVGPITSVALKHLAETGQLVRQSKVRKADAAKWYEAENIKGLFASSEVGHISRNPAASKTTGSQFRPPPSEAVEANNGKFFILAAVLGVAGIAVLGMTVSTMLRVNEPKLGSANTLIDSDQKKEVVIATSLQSESGPEIPVTAIDSKNEQKRSDITDKEAASSIRIGADDQNPNAQVVTCFSDLEPTTSHISGSLGHLKFGATRDQVKKIVEEHGGSWEPGGSKSLDENGFVAATVKYEDRWDLPPVGPALEATNCTFYKGTLFPEIFSHVWLVFRHGKLYRIDLYASYSTGEDAPGVPNKRKDEHDAFDEVVAAHSSKYELQYDIIVDPATCCQGRVLRDDMDKRISELIGLLSFECPFHEFSSTTDSFCPFLDVKAFGNEYLLSTIYDSGYMHSGVQLGFGTSVYSSYTRFLVLRYWSKAMLADSFRDADIIRGELDAFRSKCVAVRGEYVTKAKRKADEDEAHKQLKVESTKSNFRKAAD